MNSLNNYPRAGIGITLILIGVMLAGGNPPTILSGQFGEVEEPEYASSAGDYLKSFDEQAAIIEINDLESRPEDVNADKGWFDIIQKKVKTFGKLERISISFSTQIVGGVEYGFRGSVTVRMYKSKDIGRNLDIATTEILSQFANGTLKYVDCPI